jgi:hypothetical protein
MPLMKSILRLYVIFSSILLFSLVLNLTLSSPNAWAANEDHLISTAAGQVGELILTSREVILYSIVENEMSNRKPLLLNSTSVKTREFARETTAALIETGVSLEFDVFGAGEWKENEVKILAKKVLKRISANPITRQMEYDGSEVDSVVRKKLKAKQFIKFKIDSAVVPVSDKEAEDYFQQNNLKFENLPFENFKQNIKSYLMKQQSDRRLRDWFELLQSRYRVRNFLAE